MSPGRSEGRTISQRTARSLAHGPRWGICSGQRRAVGERRREDLTPPRSSGTRSGDCGRASLAEASGEERIEESGGRDERGVGALAQDVLRALDRGDAAYRENGAVPGAGLAPGEHLLDLPRCNREGLGPYDIGALAAGPLEGRGALV